MFKKILIANRGEIAVRVIRACHEMNIAAVAVYSEADRTALHVRLADEAYLIGPPPSGESYLNIPKVLGAARKSRADAIHPGYGFLSENPDFVAACETEGIPFIGPPPGPMKLLGNKIEARRLAHKAGLPVVPGSLEPLTSLDTARRTAKDIGYPVMLKAAAGGGGRGMRLVRDEGEMESALRAARAEALTAFGDDTIYMEKAVESPKHIEFQILCDGFGRGVHLYDRECSIQRRHQKLIEESPSVSLDPETRKKIGALAVKTALAAGYVNAGTMEFIMDERKNLYFLEVNTRLQVEHPVTEFVTGVDLVRTQIGIAAGKRLPWTQKEILQRGAAIECRICAEDPLKNFLPTPGRVTCLRPPGGGWVREDSGIYEGWEVPSVYDSLLSKLVVWGRDRSEAVERMRRALDEYCITGVPTTLPFHRWALTTREFLSGAYTTGFVGSVFSPSSIDAMADRDHLPAVLGSLFAYVRDQERRKKFASPAAPGGRGGCTAWALVGRREGVDRVPER